MIVGTVSETFPGERRVALVPNVIPSLTKAGWTVLIEAGAGDEAGFADKSYQDKGAEIAKTRADVFQRADVILQVRGYGANLEKGKDDLALMKSDQVVLATFDPLTSLDAVKETAAKGISLFAMELIPRITRAQSMDMLSSMATIAGYRAVLLAAQNLNKMFPMMMTAAGTIAPARVFIIGAGVAGLQAIATSRRLGAQVDAYDLRPAVKEQVMSLGAKFVEMDLEGDNAEDKGGYAKAMGEEFYRKQRELMTRVVADTDVVITTAAIPGKKAPLLITEDMVKAMPSGSVIIDLAAERGGNCELTKPGETVVAHGVRIVGPLNLASDIPYHASQMYSKNLATLLLHLTKDGAIDLNVEDEIIAETMVTHKKEVCHPRIKEIMNPGTKNPDPASAAK